MLGRTPGNIVTVRPMKDGVIADFTMTEAMLQHECGQERDLFHKQPIGEEGRHTGGSTHSMPDFNKPFFRESRRTGRSDEALTSIRRSVDTQDEAGLHTLPQQKRRVTSITESPDLFVNRQPERSYRGVAPPLLLWSAAWPLRLAASRRCCLLRRSRKCR